MTGRRALWTAAVLAFTLALAALGATAPAAAHSSQIGSSPEADTTIAAVPAEVSVDFDTPLLDIGAAMVVRTDGRTVSVDPPTVGRRSISIGLEPDAPAGAYSVAYRVVSEDGHTIESTFAFTVAGAAPDASPSALASPASATEPATESATEPPTESTPAGDPPYLLIGIGIAALLALVIGALALSR